MTGPGEISIESTLESLRQMAVQIASHSYSPYSGFRVGSAILLSNGEIVTGTNVENVSYGLTICAERSALVSAIAKFGPQIRIEAVAVANLNEAPSPPCGACRQVLAEFMGPDSLISFPGGTTGAVQQITLPMSELLPHGFDLKLK
jgi:cytidine deaminase